MFWGVGDGESGVGADLDLWAGGMRCFADLPNPGTRFLASIRRNPHTGESYLMIGALVTVVFLSSLSVISV